MGKKTTPQGQLSWLDLAELEDPVEEESEDLSTVGKGWHVEMPEYIVCESRWVNGDVSPEALERLSHVRLGDVEVFARSDTGEKYKYIVVTTAVIGQRVWCACKRYKSLKELFGQAHGNQGDEDVD